MQTTANYGLKKPEGNDTVDIDVINGNMDTIDEELSKRAPGGYGLGTMAADISNQDLNNYNTTGFFRGSSMTNAPNIDWYYVEVVGHDEKWTLQVATNYFNNNMYYRRKNNGTWQGWVRIANIADIPGSLPASGGDSTTVGGFSASGTPSTTEKSNLIGMVNELFQSASSGKSLIATAAGSPSLSSETFSQLATDITNGKNNIYNAISAKGTTPASKNFVDLASGIESIKTGYVIGDIISEGNLIVKYPKGSVKQLRCDSNASTSSISCFDSCDKNGNIIVFYFKPSSNYTGCDNAVWLKYDPSGKLIFNNEILIESGKYASGICSVFDENANLYLAANIYNISDNSYVYTIGKKIDNNGNIIVDKKIDSNIIGYKVYYYNDKIYTMQSNKILIHDIKFNLISMISISFNLYYTAAFTTNNNIDYIYLIESATDTYSYTYNLYCADTSTGIVRKIRNMYGPGCQMSIEFVQAGQCRFYEVAGGSSTYSMIKFYSYPGITESYTQPISIENYDQSKSSVYSLIAGSGHEFILLKNTSQFNPYSIHVKYSGGTFDSNSIQINNAEGTCVNSDGELIIADYIYNSSTHIYDFVIKKIRVYDEYQINK